MRNLAAMEANDKARPLNCALSTDYCRFLIDHGAEANYTPRLTT